MTARRYLIGDELRHRKGGKYRVVDYCIIEKTNEEAYLYRAEDGRLFVRPAQEMEDGRFTLIPKAAF